MENTATIHTTVGGGAHGHLSLILTVQRYLQLMEVNFVPQKQSGTTPGTTKSIYGTSRARKSLHHPPPTTDNISEVPQHQQGAL
eukprot:15031882-Ditylum_brightwellii.AAC.2